MDRIAAAVLDDTFRTALSGESKEFRESSSSLMFAFVLAIVLIFLVLAAQFESFKDPLVVMLTVPLAVAGALVFMWMTGGTMNIFSQIGIIMLIGLVAKNGILIVEFANQKQAAGETKAEAVVGASLQRMRPILMTSFSTILGLLPLAFASGDGARSRVAMGVAVTGGMLISTIMTLYVVPAMYSFLSTDRSKHGGDGGGDGGSDGGSDGGDNGAGKSKTAVVAGALVVALLTLAPSGAQAQRAQLQQAQVQRAQAQQEQQEQQEQAQQPPLAYYEVPSLYAGAQVDSVAPQATMTLAECLQTGLENNYSVRIARAEQQTAADNATWGNAGFLPTVGVSGGYNAALQGSRTTPREGAATTEHGALNGALSAGLDVSWTIFNGMSVRTNMARLRELKAMGELAARITVEDFVASLTAEYYNYIQQTIRLGNFRYAVGMSRQRLSIAEARYMLGNGSRGEVLQARVDLNADSSLYIIQKERISTSRIRINELMASGDVGRTLAVRDSVISIDESLEWGGLNESVALASSRLAHARRNGALAELDAKMVRSRSYPYLALGAGYGYAANTYNKGGTRNRHSWGPDAGLTASFTIFDGNRRREIANARREADNAALRAAEIETSLHADLATFWQAYRNNLQLLSLERENLKAARQNYEIAHDLYMNDVLAGIELRQAQMSLLDGEERLLVALYNTKVCEISLLQVSGRVLEYLE